MSDLANRIRQVHAHVDRLRTERERLASAKFSLEENLRESHRSLDVLRARITELERENEVLRAVKPAPVAGTDRSGSKERIDDLVNEIDRCLALLTN
jgi:septal ring factor EnvC (AmiA/AmiB activator)